MCGRARCAADAAALGQAGCPACAARPRPRHRAPTALERLLRGALAALGAAVLAGTVSAQYVGAELFAYLAPLVVGVVCGAAAQAAAGGPRRGTTAVRVRAVAAACAVLGVGLGLLLEGSEQPVSSAAALPAALAVVGAVVWTAPPRRSGRSGTSDRSDRGATGGRAG